MENLGTASDQDICDRKSDKVDKVMNAGTTKLAFLAQRGAHWAQIEATVYSLALSDCWRAAGI